MFNMSLRCMKINFKSLFHNNYLSFQSKFPSRTKNTKCTCLCICDKYYDKNIYLNNLRFYATSSHRQKLVIETTQPKIIVDKRNSFDETDLSKKDRYNVKLKVLWKDKVNPYIKLARWDRPIGVYLLYWPCTWSIALASLPAAMPLQVTAETALLFLIGAGLMRGAGCTINDLWDRDIDSKVERTKDRPLVSGAITQKQAMAFLAVQLSLALGVLTQLNCFSVALGASSMLLVVTYPLAKRFTNYPQIFLGATFNWGALLGYSAVHATLDLMVCVPLYIGALAWTVIYDTIYAHQDKADDMKIGIKSTAITFGAGTKRALFTSLAVSVASLACAGHAAGLNCGYDAVLAATAFYAGRQIYSLNVNNSQDCGDKFKSNSMYGALVLLGILIGGYDQYEKKLKVDTSTEWSASRSCLFS